MKLDGRIDAVHDQRGIAAPHSGRLPLVSLESLAASARQPAETRAA